MAEHACASDAPVSEVDDLDQDETIEQAADDDDAVQGDSENHDAVEATEAEITGPELKHDNTLRAAAIFYLAALVALIGLVVYLGVHTYQAHKEVQRRAALLQAGRQEAINLTTISWQHPDADVHRILESAIDPFYDEFSSRSAPFVEVVKQAQSTSTGTVTEAGLESVNGDTGQVLVAMTVKTSNVVGVEQQPRLWRMRITVQRADGQLKVSNVQFVP